MMTPADRSPSSERTLLPVLFGLTFSTGIVDAASFLGLGHVFTANMTGNVVFLSFALAGAPGMSVSRSSTALAGYLAGAVLGGRLTKAIRSGPRDRCLAVACAAEAALLFAALGASLGSSAASSGHAGRLSVVIVLTALAMGVRNAAIRSLGVPDMSTTVLTLTITGLAADSTPAGGDNPRWRRRVGSVLAMAAGAAAGALLLRHSLARPLAACGVIACACALALHLQGHGTLQPPKEHRPLGG